jgi:hypothetical protein
LFKRIIRIKVPEIKEVVVVVVIPAALLSLLLLFVCPEELIG